MSILVLIVFFSLYSLMLYTLYRIRRSRNGYYRSDREDDDHGGGEPFPDNDPILDLPPGIAMSTDIDERNLYPSIFRDQTSTFSGS